MDELTPKNINYMKKRKRGEKKKNIVAIGARVHTAAVVEMENRWNSITLAWWGWEVQRKLNRLIYTHIVCIYFSYFFFEREFVQIKIVMENHFYGYDPHNI